jgi:hypothetical protein
MRIRRRLSLRACDDYYDYYQIIIIIVIIIIIIIRRLLIYLFRPHLIISSKVFQVVLVRMVYNSALFLVPRCCSFLLNAVLNNCFIQTACKYCHTRRVSCMSVPVLLSINGRILWTDPLLIRGTTAPSGVYMICALETGRNIQNCKFSVMSTGGTMDHSWVVL